MIEFLIFSLSCEALALALRTLMSTLLFENSLDNKGLSVSFMIFGVSSMIFTSKPLKFELLNHNYIFSQNILSSLWGGIHLTSVQNGFLFNLEKL